MPDIAQHHAFGQDVRASLSPEIREYLSEDPYTFALYGPDPWFMYQLLKRRNGRGRRMHTTWTGAFLTALAEKARDGSAPKEMFSYLAGFLCHYALDSAAHPYIIWQATETWPTKRAHRDLEHTLDIVLLKREGFWGEAHPVTDHHFPAISLPDSMARDLEEVYERVYGWKDTFRPLNRCYSLYRKLYRLMEAPHSVLTFLSAVFPTHRFLSLSYYKSVFMDRDAENLSHLVWHQPYAREETSAESYPELYEKARAEAVRMISDAWAYARLRSMDPAALAESIGNRSYLSGLDVNDPRNHLVAGLRPSE